MNLTKFVYFAILKWLLLGLVLGVTQESTQEYSWAWVWGYPKDLDIPTQEFTPTLGPGHLGRRKVPVMKYFEMCFGRRLFAYINLVPVMSMYSYCNVNVENCSCGLIWLTL